MTTPIRDPNAQYYYDYNRYWGLPSETVQPPGTLPEPPPETLPVPPPVETAPPPPDPAAVRAQERQQFQQACQTLATHFGDLGPGWFDGCIDENALAAAERGERGPEAQQAAKFLLEHRDMLK